VSAQHTPGPWTYKHAENGELEIKGPNDECVVDGCGCCNSPFGDNLEYDARLIAAAPDLLAALHNMLEDGDKTDREQALAAIAKATGSKP